MSVADSEISEEDIMKAEDAPDAGAVHYAEHKITVSAPADRVYGLVADVQKWPQLFGPTIHAEQVGQDGQSEQIRIWATANETVKTWTSRRTLDPAARTIAFRQERSQHPVGGMGGTWAIEPLAEDECYVRLSHDYFAATGEPADLDWIATAVDRNSTAELRALKSAAEADDSRTLLTFADTVDVDGAAADVYDFINEADLWEKRLPHVLRVSLQEDTPGLQVLEMDTRAADGSVHTTRSVRLCEPHHKILYKQVVLPGLLTLHTGRWLIEERAPSRVSVTSEHTIKIDESRITAILGENADLASAREFVRGALSGNSLATLRHAKSYAEASARRD
jgi:aromatase